MIKDVMEYSGIAAKIRAMRAKLLKSEDYRKIAAMHTVTEVIYYLKETKAPSGYTALKDPVEFSVTKDSANSSQLDIINTKGFTLPSTGGQGMVALVAAGICLMAAMAALMVSYMRKRRNA